MLTLNSWAKVPEGNQVGSNIAAAGARDRGVEQARAPIQSHTRSVEGGSSRHRHGRRALRRRHPITGNRGFGHI